MPIIAPAMAASSFPKTGSPRPGGQPVAVTSTIPPTESPASRAARISASIASGSTVPWTSMTLPLTSIPCGARQRIATAPAATRARVSLPEDLPPPLWSRSPYFACQV